MTERIKSNSMFLGVFLFFIPFNIFILSVIYNVLNIPLAGTIFYISLLLSIFIVWFYSTVSIKYKISFILFAIIVLGLSLIYAYIVQGFAYDARVYHLPASIALAEGWNPLRDPSGKFFNGKNYQMWSLAVFYYAKAQWYINAVTSLAFKSIEVGKFVHISMIFSSFFIVYDYTSKFFSRKSFAVIVALVIALNPISFIQVSINYLDGTLASVLTILIFSLLNTTNKAYLVLAILATVLAANLKVTGLIFSAFIWFAFLIISIIDKKHYGFSYKTIIYASLISASLSISFGYNPYVTNTISKGTPLYPYTSSNDEEKYVLPRPYWNDENRFERFVISYSSATNHISGREQSYEQFWKNPLEFENIWNFNVNSTMARTVGGFGPFYGFALLLSIPLVFFVNRTYVVLIAMLWFTAFVTTEGWHARYFSHLWLMPLMVFLGTFFNKKRYIRILSLIGMLLMLLNIVVLFKNTNFKVEKSQEYLYNLDAYKALYGEIDENFTDQYGTSINSFSFVEQKRVEFMGYKFNEESIKKNINLVELISKFEKGIVIITAKDDFRKKLNKEYINFMQSRFNSEIKNAKFRSSYIAVIKDSKIEYEKSSMSKLNYEFIYEDTSIKIISAGMNSGNKSSIKVNNKELSLNQRGINICASPDGIAFVCSTLDTHKGDTKLKRLKYFFIK